MESSEEENDTLDRCAYVGEDALSPSRPSSRRGLKEKGTPFRQPSQD
jgi:hypothetical protein